MDNYLDKEFAAFQGVLLLYAGNDLSLNIPKQLADMDIHTIGDGAIMEAENLRQVVLPDGIKNIGERSFESCNELINVYIPNSVDSVAENSFDNCPKLSNIFVYRIVLNERRYKDLISSSKITYGSTYLSLCFPDIKKLRDIISSTDFTVANYIQSDIPRLFTSQSLDEEKGYESLKRNLDGFTFDGKERYTTEIDLLPRLLEKSDYSSEIDPTSEKMNDEFVKLDKIPQIMKTAVFTFDDSKTIFKNGKYMIFANIKIGYHFWQSKVPVIFSGNKYYIYRRHYLSSTPNLNYIRKDVAVLTDKGFILDRKEAQKVYAKYRLLSIL